MAASANKTVHIDRKALSLTPQLLRLSAFAAVGLFNIQTVMAQTSAVELAIPQPASEAPAAPLPAAAPPAPTVIAPEVAPVTPSNIVPNSIETTAPETNAVDHGAVFLETAEEPNPPAVVLEGLQPASTPQVEVISPADYGTAQIDTTDYSVGATMPEVVISERSSGCEFALEAGSEVANAACNQVNRLAESMGLSPTRPGGIVSPANISNISIPGAQAVSLTTAASRDYYNQAAQAVVKLQLGQKFIFPLSMPGYLTSLFGWRIHPIAGVRRFHSGTDVGAPLGTPVVATQAGQVVMSDVAGGYGLMVVLHHNDGTLESRYAHLSRLLVQAGEWVEQGEVIGLVGSTGNSTGPHLHFELRQLTENGWAVLNPDSLLRQTLGTLAQAMGSSITALSANAGSDLAAVVPNEAALPGDGLPFRPAQPHAN
ncbi:MAG: M23 family metallopeptidase [Cyanobacteria bacterium P01_C01_bin.118]